ncbi:hypothetical protein [Mesorhizobium sp.]|uniref:hypothetical protein n=1 Tax=Mesorhizobium sp. TaxID=1871066 RepID=UPI00257B534F|nr:hypothetical protein [Mesorhizobium sp.]
MGSAPVLGARPARIMWNDAFVAVGFGGRVNGNLGRRQCEDQPAFASIDCWKTQNIAKKCAVRLGIRAVDDHVCTGNHGSLPP